MKAKLEEIIQIIALEAENARERAVVDEKLLADMMFPGLPLDLETLKKYHSLKRLQRSFRNETVPIIKIAIGSELEVHRKFIADLENEYPWLPAEWDRVFAVDGQ